MATLRQELKELKELLKDQNQKPCDFSIAESTPKSSRVLEILVTFLLGVVLTGVIAWINLGRDAVTRPQVEAIIASYSPYVKDKPMLIERIDNLTTRINAIQSEGIAKLSEKFSTMEHQLTQLNAKFEAFLENESARKK